MPTPHREDVDSEEYLTVKEIARRWRVCNQCVYDLMSRGELPHYNFGRSKRVRRIELLEYEERVRRVDGPVPPAE